MGSIKMAKLDFLTVKNQTKGYLISALFIVLVFSLMSDTFLALGLSCAWVTSLYGTMTFMVEENNCLERFYSTVSLRANDVVAGRFLSTFALYAATLTGGVVIFIAVFLARGLTPDAVDIFTGISLSLVAFSIMMGVQTPLFFKMGYMKGRNYATIPLLALFILFILPSFIPSLTFPVELITAISNFLIPISILVSGVVLFVSYRTSLDAYRKRR